MRPTIYVAANGQAPIYLDALSKHYQIFHPGYNYDPKVMKDAPTFNNRYQQALATDFYGVSKADVLVFDVDSEPGEWFLAWAYALDKPIIAVSENLMSPGPYWGACIKFLLKPDQLLGHLMASCKELEEKRQEEMKRNEEIIKERSGKKD